MIVIVVITSLMCFLSKVLFFYQSVNSVNNLESGSIKLSSFIRLYDELTLKPDARLEVLLVLGERRSLVPDFCNLVVIIIYLFSDLLLNV